MERTDTHASQVAEVEKLEEFRHVIGGELVDSADGRTFESVNPHTGRVYATVAEGGREDAERAVRAARKAFDEGPWPRMATAERRRLLNKLADRVQDELERLSVAETIDMGKPITESRGFDMPRVVRNLRFFADFQDQAVAETYPMPGLPHLHALRAEGSRGRDLALEFPPHARLVEVRAGARLRQHRRPEAGGAVSGYGNAVR